MKRFNSILGIFLSAVFTTACTTGLDEQPMDTAFQPKESTVVSVDQAVANLRTVLDATSATRTAPTFDTSTIETYTDGAVTRAGEEKALAYIVNFEQGGYAILGADRRQSPLLALVNEGSMTPVLLREAQAAVETGAIVDAPTMIRASISKYLEAKTLEPCLTAAQTRSLPFVILEQRDSMMKTAWSPDESKFAATSHTAIALLQMLVYNGRYNNIFFTWYQGRVLNWKVISGVAEYRHLNEAPQVHIDGFNVLLFPYFHTMSSFADSIGTLGQIDCYQEITSVPLSAENVRSMVYIDKKPTVACYDLASLQGNGWVIDGWMKLSMNGMVSCHGYCKFGADLKGSDNGFYDLEAATYGISITQSMLAY